MSNSSTSALFTNAVVDYQKASAVKQATRTEPLSRVLIIYTGGTIGMKAMTPGQGYVPVPNWLCDTLQTMQRFNHPTTTNDMQSSNQDGESGRMHVRRMSQPGSIASVSEVPQLITPLSIYGKRICYSIIEYDPLLDSSNMGMNDWIQIASDIELNYRDFDAFVILHGTDTMAYTASALSFMLENLGKTVILTGSQVPLAEWRTDAEENLLGSLLIAGHFVIPEVCLYFDNKLYRGNRCTKIDAMDFAAFDSPNLKPLATVGVNIDIDWSEIRRPHAIAKFHVHRRLNPNVATLRLFPGITAATVNAFLAPPMQGVVLETYGAGNAPTARADLLDLLSQASERGVVIVNCTQCKRGIVSDDYATGKALKNVGVVPGSDMTPECALTKLAYLLDKENNMPETVRHLIQKDLRGELTAAREEPAIAGPDDPFSPFWQSIIEAFRRYAHAATAKDHQMVIQSLMPQIMCLAATHNDAETLESLMTCLSPDQTRIAAYPEDSVVALLSFSDSEGRTALHVATIAGNLVNVTRLLTLGANVHARDSMGRTPLTYALINGHEEIANILVKAGGFWDMDDELQWTFFRAVEQGNTDRIRLFVENGWDVNQKMLTGQTALHIATIKGYTSLVEFLVKATKISVDTEDDWGFTARDYAEKRHLLNIVEILSANKM